MATGALRERWPCGPTLSSVHSTPWRHGRRRDRPSVPFAGFTDEDLDFISNYDIKYRMGRDSEAEEA